MTELKYLAGYSSEVTESVLQLIKDGRLAGILQKRYPHPHEIRTDKALYAYTTALKNRYLKQTSPLSKVVFDDKLDTLHQALGLHTLVSRPQGSQLKAKHEIRIGSVFKKAPQAFLNMIIVHELAHLREKDHNKAFYKLCQHIEPDYHQHEFDCRLYLTCLELRLIDGGE